MFGLSGGELLVIAVVILAIVGPAGAAKLLRSIREVNHAKRELTEAVSLENLVTSQLDGLVDGTSGERSQPGRSTVRKK